MERTRYSRLYIERGAREVDSLKARRRLSAWCNRNLQNWIWPIYSAIKEEIGYHFEDDHGTIDNVITDFFCESELTDLLDAITIIKDCIIDSGARAGDNAVRGWISFISRVLDEENLAYRIDDRAIIHPFVDQEFETNRSAALEVLNDARFGEARRDFEDAFRHLRNREGKAAIRSMFPAVETAAKVLFPGMMARLMPNEIDRYFIPKLRDVYIGNQPAIDAGIRLLHGMKDWINAAQPYRHGQEIEEPAEPPTNFVEAFLSQGASYLRWIVELCG